MALLGKIAVGRGRHVGWLFLSTSCQVNGSLLMPELFHLPLNIHSLPFSTFVSAREANLLQMYYFSLSHPVVFGQWGALAEDQRKGEEVKVFIPLGFSQ